MVLLLGKMLSSVVNSNSPGSYLQGQKTFSCAVKFDIFKEPGTVSPSTHQKLNIAHLFHGGGRGGEISAPIEMSRVHITFPRCYAVSLDSEIALTNTNSPQWGRRFKGLSIPGEARGPGQGCLCRPPKDQRGQRWQW